MSDDRDGFLSRWSRRKAADREGRPARQPDDTAVQPSGRPDAGSQVPGQAMALADRQAAAPVKGPHGSAASAASRPMARAGSAPAGPAVARTEAPEPQAEAPALPTLDDVAPLTPTSDFRPFMRAGVDPSVRNAALKKMFVDPRFNVIDEMDIDIMDYNLLEPLPASMLRRMSQAHALGLFRDEENPPGDGTDAGPDAPDADPDAVRVADASPQDRLADEVPGDEPLTDPHPAAHPSGHSSARLPTDEDPDLRLQPDDAAGPHGDRPSPGPSGRHES